eukprot:CAMPEP_0114390344 /NCGR_PEP_ID=MMETSP0102-20121206/9309_1 /TAXON_ID=38822 ORGANISM="Pteridomonas danica, Strain PT" /NCGR_SAMPLE_ID=MMETSP0102 /ASSEMBLY_ACC=CAM_ASM_000212 /LENGTH=122 /DNA_ID=CAMNT_0001548639 /DNA_START=238 /DNA_END=607 /DNA_ORIENTATION=-
MERFPFDLFSWSFELDRLNKLFAFELGDKELGDLGSEQEDNIVLGKDDEIGGGSGGDDDGDTGDDGGDEEEMIESLLLVVMLVEMSIGLVDLLNPINLDDLDLKKMNNQMKKQKKSHSMIDL